MGNRMKDWTLEDLAKELANYWYQDAKYTANSRWEECYEEALKILTAKLAEERQSDYKDSLAELEIAMHHELDLMANRLLKELPTASHQVLTEYIYRRHREIEAEFEAALKGGK